VIKTTVTHVVLFSRFMSLVI